MQSTYLQDYAMTIGAVPTSRTKVKAARGVVVATMLSLGLWTVIIAGYFAL